MTKFQHDNVKKINFNYFNFGAHWFNIKSELITIDLTSPDPKPWFQTRDHDNSTFTLYQDARTHNLKTKKPGYVILRFMQASYS